VGGKPMARAVTVAFVEDQPVAIEGVRSWIARDPERRLRLVATGGSVPEILDGPGKDADVLLLDLQLADRPNVEQALPFIIDEVGRLADSGRRVVIYSHESSDHVIQALLNGGASAYICKDEVRDHLIETIVATGQDRPGMTPSMAGAILADEHRPALSEQEHRAVLLWLQGMPKKSVARRMSLSEHSVKQYIERVYVKYAKVGRPVRAKAELLARVIEDGHIRADEIHGYDSFTAQPRQRSGTSLR
jgi:two-component system nitrate/nitrite response regulator NarL